MPLTFKDVTEILKLIDASQCDEVALELEGTRLVVRRNTAGSSEAAFTPASADEAPVTLTSAAPAAVPSADTAAQDEAPAPQPGLTDVRTPMVGTFYRRPSPDEPTFVKEGASVSKGEPLGLIEVMKLYTTIEAPCDGVVEVIAVDDAALVEFDQLLFRIRTT